MKNFSFGVSLTILVIISMIYYLPELFFYKFVKVDTNHFIIQKNKIGNSSFGKDVEITRTVIRISLTVLVNPLINIVTIYKIKMIKKQSVVGSQIEQSK